ncbi:MAG: hypothetical protein M3416_03855 [Acidobacteriota bacterium]|nr:hypothetical protein [Acidobacteriota bacterium]
MSEKKRRGAEKQQFKEMPERTKGGADAKAKDARRGDPDRPVSGSAVILHGERRRVSPSEVELFHASSTEETRLVGDIDAAMRGIEEMREKARRHDDEIARFREETRRLIAEMQKELKAA